MESQEYRLQEISNTQRILEAEKTQRAGLSKKYRRARKIVDDVDMSLIGGSMLLSAGGAGLLCTIVAPDSAVLVGVAAGCGAVGIAGKYLSKRLSTKAEKHEKIKTLALTKLNTISSYISKALTDGKISDEEYQLISLELDKYYKMKDEVRRSARKEIDKRAMMALFRSPEKRLI